jgi:membrane-associated phospholipid phosphatase
MINKISLKWCCLTAAFVATVAFFLLAWAFPTFPGDRGVLLGFQENQSGWLDTAALTVTSLGGWAVAIAMMVGLILYFAVRRRRIDALIVLISAAPVLAGFLLKEVVGRARPDFLITGSAPSSMSFPSGHALFAMVFGGLLIVLVGELVESAPVRRTLQFGLALLILAVGASRVYLGVHWPSDVLGGYLFGGMALMGLIFVRNMMLGPRSTA